jgi:hypothetical protein
MTIHNPKIKMQSVLMEAISRVVNESEQIIERDVSDSEFRAIISKDIKEKLISPEEVNTLLNMCQQAAGDEKKEQKCKAKLLSFVQTVGKRANALPKPGEVEGTALTTLGASNMLGGLAMYHAINQEIHVVPKSDMFNVRFLIHINSKTISQSSFQESTMRTEMRTKTWLAKTMARPGHFL